MSELLRIAVVSIAASIVLLVLGKLSHKRLNNRNHISGRLVIDTTGERDRWTIFFDDDLGDVEKMDKVILRIEKIE